MTQTTCVVKYVWHHSVQLFRFICMCTYYNVSAGMCSNDTNTYLSNKAAGRKTNAVHVLLCTFNWHWWRKSKRVGLLIKLFGHLQVLLYMCRTVLHSAEWIWTVRSSAVSSPGANIINTNCSAAHTRQALCCKMSVEYDKFIESQKKWVKLDQEQLT